MFDRILVPVDGSPTSHKGLMEAIAVAKLTGGRIRVMHVVDEPQIGLGTEAAMVDLKRLYAAANDTGQRVLDAAKQSVEAAGVGVDGLLCEASNARLCDRVAEVAQSWGATLVVVGTHGRGGVRRLLLGSDAEQILRVSPVPVLLMRADMPRSAP